MTVTLITTGCISILHLILTVNVGRVRIRTKTSLGDGGDENLLRAIRAHANNAEFAPLMLILLGLLEYVQANNYLVLALGALMVLARVMHGYGLGFTDGSVSIYRAGGSMLTVLTMLVASVTAILKGYGLV